MKRERLLVFAPHPDDEVIGCGGLLALKRSQGASIRVVVVSDGLRGFGWGQTGSAETRQQECLAGLAMLGIEDVHFWQYPDGAVPLSGRIVEDYRAEFASFLPTMALLPAPAESHPDHRRVARGLLQALENHWDGKLCFYETMQPAASLNSTVDISEVIEQKLAAIGAHDSQCAQFDYVAHGRNLARLRGLAAGCEYGEGYLVFDWDGSRQHFFETRPLVSVVVRADCMAYLRHALLSLARQEYDQIEVILVWFGDAVPDLEDFSVLDLRLVAGERSRGHNLNLGVSCARGEYASFLDQDDVLLPEHFAVLLAEIHGQPDVDVVYGGCKVLACRLDGSTVQVEKQVRIMSRPFQRGRLLVGNTIPIHALLFRMQVLRREKFDSSLGAYEDWEFLARLDMAGYHFAHVNTITCEYRLFGAGNESIESSHQQKDYQSWNKEVTARIQARMTPDDLLHVAALVGQLEQDGSTFEAKASSHLEALDAQQSRIAEFDSFRELLHRGLLASGVDRTGRSGLAHLIGRSLSVEPLFSIILPVYETPPGLLGEALFSVVNQAYPGWELCLVDDASSHDGTLQVLADFLATYSPGGKVRFHRRSQRGGIVAASNDALNMASAPFVAFLDHDDRLHEEALLSAALALGENPDCELIYSDSRMIDHAGELLHVYKKADWSPETLLHLNYINHLTIIRTGRLKSAGGLRAAFDGAQDWDLLLRATRGIDEKKIRHLPQPLYDWRATPSSVAYHVGAKPEAFAAAGRAVEAELSCRHFSGLEVVANPDGIGLLCNWESECLPVEVVIPTHSNAAGLKNCMDGLLEGTDYPDFSITLMANRCESVEMLSLLDHYASCPNVRVIVDNRVFNWAELNNVAVAASQAPWLLFLNDDVRIMHRDWLLRMTRYLALDGVGAVGASLYYADGSLQHGGIQTHPAWIARNLDSLGNKNELSMTRNVSAVTGACLLTSRQFFRQAGGFDEKLAVSYNDVDFCLALRACGLRVVQPSDVRLVHDESATRGGISSPEKRRQWEDEIAIMRTKWGDFLVERYFMEYQVHAQGTRVLHLA